MNDTGCPVCGALANAPCIGLLTSYVHAERQRVAPPDPMRARTILTSEGGQPPDRAAHPDPTARSPVSLPRAPREALEALARGLGLVQAGGPSACKALQLVEARWYKRRHR